MSEVLDGRPPATPTAPPASVVDGLVLVLWTVVAQVVVGIGALAVGADLTDLEGPAPAAAAVVAQALTIVGVVAWLAVRGRLIGTSRRWRAPRAVDVPIGLGIGIAGFLVATLVTVAMTVVLDEVREPDQIAFSWLEQPGITMLLALVIAVVGAPLVEELVFRGVLLVAVRERIGAPAAVVVSALVFALIHQELWATPEFLVPLFALALVFGTAFVRTASLTATVVGHATFNAITVVLALTTT